MQNDDAWTLLEEIASETDAHLMQGYLEGAGVPCQIESLVLHAEPVTVGQLARVRIWVLQSQLQEARALLQSLEAEPAEDPPAD